MATPANTQSRSYIDFNTAFLQHPVSNDLGRVYDAEAVRQSIRRLILTNKYERRLNPQIGSNVQKILFEPMDGTTTSVLQNYIKETIQNYEPRAILQQVTVTPNYSQQSYSVTIIFSTVFTQNAVTLSFFLYRVR
jgi:phage baseplate assembly protein W